MDIRNWKEEHPKAAKVIKIVTATGLVIVVSVGGHIWRDKGCRIEITTRETRMIRNASIGYSENLKNAARGIEAKGLDASKTWSRYDAIISPYC